MKKTYFVKKHDNTEYIVLPGGTINFKIPSFETEDRIGVYESSLNPQTIGAPMHLHRKMEEIFYVIDGELSMIVGTERVIGHAGDVIFIPRGTPHGFSNKTSTPLKLLLIFSPAQAREGYFEGMAALVKRGETFDSKAFLTLMAKYDQELVEIEDNWLLDFK